MKKPNQHTKRAQVSQATSDEDLKRSIRQAASELKYRYITKELASLWSDAETIADALAQVTTDQRASNQYPEPLCSTLATIEDSIITLRGRVQALRHLSSPFGSFESSLFRD